MLEDALEPKPSVNFVPCVKWVRRGVAKRNPDKIALTEGELESLIKKATGGVGDVDEEELEAIKRHTGAVKKDENSDDSDEDNEDNEDDEVQKDCDYVDTSTAFGATAKEENDSDEDDDDDEVEKDQFDFAHYDDEPEKPDAVLSIGNIVVYASTSKDPYVTLNDEDDDSEREDDEIHPEDNLVLVGHVEGDASILEVYVYNEEEGSLYVHHDLLLPAYPLCLEWLNHEPTGEVPGNLCAVGSMSPVIDVWDLDMVNCLEPAFQLGKRISKRKGSKREGHRDAVLGLSWNTLLSHLLASASADKTILLWDLDKTSVASKISVFGDKVQSLQWHPFEGQTLLTGCCDSQVRVFDCRTENTFKTWQVEGEVEQVLWNHHDPFHFFASTNVGGVHYVDCRVDKPVWQLSAHNKEVTGLSLSCACPGLLLTASCDGQLKMWDVRDTPTFVSERNAGLGTVLCLESCPDSPFVVCAGGDRRENNFGVWDITYKNPSVAQRFQKQASTKAATELQPKVKTEQMDTACAAVKALSLEHHGKGGSGGVRKKKNIFKKKNKVKACKKL